MPEQKHIETVVLPDSLRAARRAERQRKGHLARPPSGKPAKSNKQPK